MIKRKKRDRKERKREGDDEEREEGASGSGKLEFLKTVNKLPNRPSEVLDNHLPRGWVPKKRIGALRATWASGFAGFAFAILPVSATVPVPPR